MALIPGEDSESDEEINTEHLQSLVLTPDGSLTGPGYRGLMRASHAQQKGAAAGIVMGEESETDEEEGEEGSVDQPDGGGGGGAQVGASLQSSFSSTGSGQEVAKEEPLEAVAAPQSLLHKKLRERNQSLRKNVVERIIKLYRITCRNLTLVNNNLSKAQGTIETVNSNLKRSEHDLSELNSVIADINLEARSIAPYLSVVVSQGPKKSPSPMRQKLLKGVPKVLSALKQASSPSAPLLPREQEEGGVPLKIPEACPEGQSPGNTGSGQELKIPEAQSEGQSSQPKITAAQPGHAEA